MDEIRLLVSQDRLLDAFTLLNKYAITNSYKNELALLLGRLTRNNKKENLGVISNNESNLERNKISNSLLELAFKVFQVDSTKENPSKDSIGIDGKIDSLLTQMENLKDDYKKLLIQSDSKLHYSLTKNYKYGYIIFGMYEGQFIYAPQKDSVERTLSIDWKKTTLFKDKRNHRYTLKLKDLFWNQKYAGKGHFSMKIGEYKTYFPLDIAQGKKYPLGIIQFSQQPNLFLEVLEDGTKGRLILVLGFNK
jgi:hypothetical protein